MSTAIGMPTGTPEVTDAGTNEDMPTSTADGPAGDRSRNRDDQPAPDEPPALPDTDEEQAEGVTIHPAVPYMRLAGVAMIGVGLLIILFLLYLIAFTPLTASRNQERLTQALVGKPLAVFALVGGKLPPDGSPVAVLEIPSLGVRQVVVRGTSASDLMNGPGLMSGSALPGTPGNSVIAAKRVTFGAPFGAIGSLRKGQRIIAVDGAGTFTYKVTRVLTVTAGQKDVVVPTADNRITLVTSDSTIVTNGRLVVQGTLVGHAVAVPGLTAAIPSFDLGLSGDPTSGGLVLIWSFLTLLALVGAALAAWRWKHPWLVYLLAAPVVMFCGLFACESLARALPATF